MNHLYQQTIEKEVRCTGVGLHSGKPLTLVIRPAAEDHGITFRRVDLPGSPVIAAKCENVVDTLLATTLGVGPARVSTVEHLLAAVAGLGLDNLDIEIDGPEIPIMDGSAAPFVYLLRAAGFSAQRRSKKFMVIRRKVTVRDGDKEATLSPARQFSVSCNIDFKHPLITDQSFEVQLSDRRFRREISRARTFGFLRDVEALKARGLARGGSIENAIVVDDFNILNPEGLRFPDEFVRHKILDAVGDLSLLGMQLIGHVELHKSGHGLHHALVKQVLANPACHQVVHATADIVELVEQIVPALRPAVEAA